MKDDKLYLIHIRECLERIEEYIKDGEEAFAASRMAQDAVVRNFEIIGEAAKKVSAELKSRWLDIPWRRIAGLRDVLIHDYEGVDIDEVWSIAHREAPELKARITEILGELEKADGNGGRT